MKLRTSIVLLASTLLTASGLQAYESEWQDETYEEGDSIPSATFKLESTIFAGYEFVDHAANGEPDSGSPTSESQGFTVGRAYITFKGTVDEGTFDGWGFRITTDIAPAAEQGGGCGTTCSEDNDYNVNLKYAYIQIPLFSGAEFRLGQQHSPIVDGQAGVSLQKFWGYRYVAQAATEALGMSSSTERGLAFLYSSDYFALHLLLGNGEGYHHNNAERVSSTFSSTSTSTILSNLSAGNNDSYAYDLYGMPSIRPTGSAKDFIWTISFPFRLQNLYGMETDEETRLYTIDPTTALGGSVDPNYQIFSGDSRAKRDYQYGVETDVQYNADGFSVTLGGGTIVKVDRRGNSSLITDDLIRAGGYRTTSTGALAQDLLVNFNKFDSDRRGLANYIFAHVEFGPIGFFGRYMEGDSSVTGNSSSTRITPADGRSWFEQALVADLSNTTIGDIGYNRLQNSVDSGSGRFINTLYGITYIASPSFQVSLGVSEVRGVDKTGREYRTNPYQRIPITAGSSTTLASALESATPGTGTGVFASQLGLSSGDTLNTNDFFGSKERNRQVFLRALFEY